MGNVSGKSRNKALQMFKSFRVYAALIGVNLIYACTSIFTKMASRQEMMSWPYLLWIAGAVGVFK